MRRERLDATLVSTASWIERLRTVWRRRFADAAEDERNGARGCLLCLDEPVRIQAVVRVAGKVPVQVVVLRLYRANGDSIGVTVAGDHGIEGGDSGFDQWLLDVAARLHASATRGWSDGRTVRPHRAGAQRLDDGSVYEIVGDLDDALLGEIVDDCFRLAAPTVPCSAVPAPEIQHAYDMKLREPELVRRVLASRAESVVARLGLLDGAEHSGRDATVVGSWIGLFLPRRRLFGGTLDGDVDLIAGLTTVRVLPERWHARVEDEVGRLPMGMNRSIAAAIAVSRACDQGLLVWPPAVRYLVGAETKVSRFGPRDDDPEWRWHATRTNDGAGVSKQLAVHWAHGIARASFWHLGVTAPAPFLWPHLNATSAAADSFPEVQLCDERFGHLAEVVGAVSGRSEADAGSHMTDDTAPSENPNWMAMSWWPAFQRSLGALPPPRGPSFFIAVCERCSAWFHSAFPSPRCSTCVSAA